MISPPMTATAMGARVSAPSPRARATGIMPAIMATVVMRIGRKRMGPASSMASLAERPSSRSWFANSTMRMPFLVTRPMSMMMPIMANMLIGSLMSSRPPSAPMIASGKPIMMDRGCSRLSNWAARDDVDQYHAKNDRGQERGDGVTHLAGLSLEARHDARWQVFFCKVVQKVHALAETDAIQVGQHHDLAHLILAFDSCRALPSFNVREAAKLHQRTGRRPDLHLAELARVRKHFGRKGDHDLCAVPFALELADLILAEHRPERLSKCARWDPHGGCSCWIHMHVELRLSRPVSGVDVDEHGGCFSSPRRFFERLPVARPNWSFVGCTG